MKKKTNKSKKQQKAQSDALKFAQKLLEHNYPSVRRSWFVGHCRGATSKKDKDGIRAIHVLQRTGVLGIVYDGRDGCGCHCGSCREKIFALNRKCLEKFLANQKVL